MLTRGDRKIMDEKKTILVVDDDPDAIAFAESVISDLGDFNVMLNVQFQFFIKMNE